VKTELIGLRMLLVRLASKLSFGGKVQVSAVGERQAGGLGGFLPSSPLKIYGVSK
jgi:hypothetical protein